METMYQRGKIQEESLYYEHKKHDGTLPLIGVNTFLPKEHAGDIATDDRADPLDGGREGPADRPTCSPSARPQRLRDGRPALRCRQTARERRNVFAALMDAVKTHSLGQISHALYEVGGEYRRNM